MHPKIRSDLNIQEVGNEALVLNIQSEQIHQLNPTALWILKQCDGAQSVDAIVARLVDVFEIDDHTARQDVNNVIKEFEQSDLLEK